MEKHLHGLLLLVIATALYINVKTEEKSKEIAIAAPAYEEFNIGITPHYRTTVTKQLEVLLADVYLLYTKTLKYHWNVEGPFFNDLHKFFAQLYEQQFTMIDRVAERIRALGTKSPGSLAEFSQKSTLKEAPGKHLSAQAMILDLLSDYQSIIRAMRSIAQNSATSNDAGTNNFMGDLIEKSEKTAWMLRALRTQ
ncbi:MAG: DNA starvation/stationary phase protection protein [Candidatus Babeliales bacterium]